MSSTFFSEFLMISNIKTLMFISFLGISFIPIYKLGIKKVSFSMRMILSTILGLLIGVGVQIVANFPSNPGEISWINEVTKWYGLVGYGFMDLLKMLVIPLVFVSIIRVIINMDSKESLGKLTGRTIVVLLSTTAIAAIVGIVVGNLFNLGVGANVVNSTSEIKEITPVVDTLRGLIPSNPIKIMVESNVVAIVVLAGFIGVAINRVKIKQYETVKPIIDLIEASYKITTSIAISIIKFMPYAVIALLANTVAGRGVSAILDVGMFIVALYISIMIMFIIHLIIVMLNGINPIKYIKQVSEPLILAFTSRSSLGTLPVTIDTLSEKVGVDNGIASFVSSLGANGGMNGCAAIYPALMTITLANMSSITMDFSFYIMLVIIIVISSLGIAGLPGTATMAVSVVVSGMGMGVAFPLAGGILAIDPILDMGRTMLNVSGTMATTVTVANSFNKIDKNI